MTHLCELLPSLWFNFRPPPHFHVLKYIKNRHCGAGRREGWGGFQIPSKRIIIIIIDFEDIPDHCFVGIPPVSGNKTLTEFSSDSFRGTEKIPEFSYESFRGLNFFSKDLTLFSYSVMMYFFVSVLFVPFRNTN